MRFCKSRRLICTVLRLCGYLKRGVLPFRGEKTTVYPTRRFRHENIYLEQQKPTSRIPVPADRDREYLYDVSAEKNQ